MSRSIHQTLKSVFGGKSKCEIQRMIDNDDPDLLALIEKKVIKRNVRDAREIERLLREAGAEPDTVE